MCIYKRELLAVFLHTDKFGDHRYSDGGMFLIGQVTSRDHMFKIFCEILSESPSSSVGSVPSLEVIVLVQRRYKVLNLSSDLTKPHD